MNIKQYISPEFLFTFNSANISPGEKLVFISGIILVLLAIVLKISAILAPNPVDAKYRRKFYGLFLTVGLGEIFWYFLRYENAMFLGTHFVALIIAVVGIVWFAVLVTNMARHYKGNKQVWDKEQVRLKYLPK
ncbi:MAG: hypothetical protein P4L74_02590 [Candidatus Doudnabacteria bacterium]|nr:hypothetical protein [Candidatus Doudnabacteria bacterium]